MGGARPDTGCHTTEEEKRPAEAYESLRGDNLYLFCPQVAGHSYTSYSV